MEALTVSIKDAAAILGLGRTKIYELIGEGRLTVLKIGRRTLVTTKSLEILVTAANQLEPAKRPNGLKCV